MFDDDMAEHSTIYDADAEAEADADADANGDEDVEAVPTPAITPPSSGPKAKLSCGEFVGVTNANVGDQADGSVVVKPGACD